MTLFILLCAELGFKNILKKFFLHGNALGIRCINVKFMKSFFKLQFLMQKSASYHLGSRLK